VTKWYREWRWGDREHGMEGDSVVDNDGEERDGEERDGEERDGEERRRGGA
jgi:hypothetical protein